MNGGTMAAMVLTAAALAGFAAMGFALVAARRRILALARERDALAETNRQGKLAQQMAGVGYWRLFNDSDRFEWSEEMYRIYGRHPSEGPPTFAEAREYVHPEDRERLDQHMERYADRDAHELQVRIVRGDGAISHVIARSLAEWDDQGNIVARLGTLADVTDVQLAQHAAWESRERYRFLADNVPDMITRTSMGGKVIYISPGSMRVFGRTPQEMLKRNAKDQVHPDDLERVMAGITRLINERLPRLPEPLVYRCRHSDGRYIWIEANPTLIFDPDGEPMEFIDVVRDVTQKKLSEAELEEARRRAEAAAAAKSAFLANMSHELRTPLTSIIGFSGLLGQRDDLPEEARAHAGRIGDASQALLAIINDVLDFSKLEAGQVALEIQPLSIARLMDETTGLVAIQAAARGLDLRVEVDEAAPPMIEGDVARLRQVLLNFLSNAVKFTEKGAVTARATWKTTVNGERLRLSVTDTGVGISPEAVKRLFERFSQAEVSINRTHGGTGLGLAISKGIAELMGGEVGVDTAVGEGATFWLEIPARAAEAEEEQSAPGSTLECPPLRILMVDDTAMNRELVRLMLAPFGFDLTEAEGGAEGVKIAMTQPFDLILMDVRMPGVDGLEATRVIRAMSAVNGRVPILALTADVQPENTTACHAAGMDDVLAKPIVAAQLIAKIVHWGAEAANEQPPAVAQG